MGLTRQDKLGIQKKQERSRVREGVHNVQDLEEGVPVLSYIDGELIEYVRFCNKLFSKNFGKVSENASESKVNAVTGNDSFTYEQTGGEIITENDDVTDSYWNLTDNTASYSTPGGEPQSLVVAPPSNKQRIVTSSDYNLLTQGELYTFSAMVKPDTGSANANILRFGISIKSVSPGAKMPTFTFATEEWLAPTVDSNYRQEEEDATKTYTDHGNGWWTISVTMKQVPDRRGITFGFPSSTGLMKYTTGTQYDYSIKDISLKRSGGYASIDDTKYSVNLPNPGIYLIYASLAIYQDGTADTHNCKVRLYNHTESTIIPNSNRTLLNYTNDAGDPKTQNITLLWRAIIGKPGKISLQGSTSKSSANAFYIKNAPDSTSEFGYIRLTDL